MQLLPVLWRELVEKGRVLCYEKINAIHNDSGYFIDILSSYVNKRTMRKSYMSELIEIYPMSLLILTQIYTALSVLITLL